MEVYENLVGLTVLSVMQGSPSLRRVDFLELEIDALDFLYRTNLRGLLVLNQALAKIMLNNKDKCNQSFIFITSSNAHAVNSKGRLLYVKSRCIHDGASIFGSFSGCRGYLYIK